jgi:hypothetical protein
VGHHQEVTGVDAAEVSFSLSGLCPCGASAGGRGFGHFAPTHGVNPV